MENSTNQNSNREYSFENYVYGIVSMYNILSGDFYHQKENGREAAVLVSKNCYVLILNNSYYIYSVGEERLQDLLNRADKYVSTGEHPVDYNPGFE